MKHIIFFLIFVVPFKTFAISSNFSFESQRKDFLFAEKLIKKGDDQQFLSTLANLKDYPLAPYLQYQWLKKNLNQTAKIKLFLEQYNKTRYAGLLKYKWQIHLAKQKQWSEFLRQYSESSNTKLQCYYYRSLYNTGSREEALMGAKKLWVVGKSQPSECDPLFKTFKSSSHFTREVLWQRFDASIISGKYKVAIYVKQLMNKKDQRVAQRWLDVHSNPSLITKKNFFKKKDAQEGLIFAHGIDRLARKKYTQAIKIWDARRHDFSINTATVDRIDQRLAMSLAYRQDKNAYGRLSQLNNPDEKTKEWRIRTALREQNWKHVDESIAKLSKEDKKKDKWRYWQARALEYLEQPKASTFMLSQIADKRSYYGYLSAERLNKSYQLSDRPIEVAAERLRRLKYKDDFLVVAELIAIDRLSESRRQWWYAVKKLDKKNILIAAKYAQELNWKQVAIFTLAKAKYWDDINMRFPLAYKKQVQLNAMKQKLNPAVIFGLIRRESAFDKNARSPVGARGLMQIMPKTGQQIARELKEKKLNVANLFDPSTNVKYGAYYYKKLLNKFGGNYALAAAAYNAGPHRVNRWLPKNGVMAADIWIETIPFTETRAYVSAVLTYALIYQQKLKDNVLSMRDFMKDVRPK